METAISPQQKEKQRIEFIDLTRGIAVALMILSHGVKGLLAFEQFPDWGLVPIHLITKFSSTLFFMVFGLSMAMIFVPLSDTERWPLKRKRLLVRGLKILFWYKVLTIVEYFQFGNREQILSALTYQSFTSFVEILGFYAIVFFWVPFVVPLWKKMPLWSKFIVPIVFYGLNHLLFYHFDFWGVPQLKAVFVEHPDFYTWGQLSRAPLVFLGMIIGDIALKNYRNFKIRSYISLGLFGISLLLFAAFYYISSLQISETLFAIAKNEGKHPPQMDFMLFSMGGAFAILALCLWGGELLAKVLLPFTIIGKDALHAFVFHIAVIFVFYRFLFDYFQKIPYESALQLTILLIAMTPIWLKVKSWVMKNS